nr:ATP-dependent DNA helicase PIF1-like [Tanacetum cinerariifolium]
MNEGSSADRPSIPTLANMLNKSIFLNSNTNIRQDGKIHSYCGLRLADIPAVGAGVSIVYHNLGPPSHQCSVCNATMWYNERSEKSRKAVTLSFSLCCQDESTIQLIQKAIPPGYAQLYFFDTQSEIMNKMSAFMTKETPKTVDENIVANLIQMLDQTSAMAKSFRMAKEWCRSHGDANFGLRLLSEITATRQYNAPTVSEVSALIINDFGDDLPIRDIVVNKNNTGPHRISELHPSYMALQYPLLFPFGEDGYHENIPYNTNKRTRKTKRGYVTTKEYYAYIIQQRQNQGTTLLRGGRLFQQGDTSAAGLGKRIVLPQIYVGSPRDNKITAVKGKFTYDNRHVVPHNRGAQSFTDLKMVNKINYATFKAACFAYGLLNDDKEWTHSIAEASIWAIAQQLRDLFVTILSFFDVSRPLKLWEENWVRNYCLLEIQDLLNIHGKSLTDFKDLPQPNSYLLTNLDNRLLKEALSFDANKSKVEHEKLHSMLNPEQRLIYEQIIKSVHNDKGQFCFIHGLGGTKKMFLYKTIIARLRSEQMIVLAVASSELMENSTCGIKQGTHLAELLQHVWLIIWDDALMTQRYAFEALDKMLQDILGYKNQAKRNRIFGGMTILLGGDFRQILPVIPNVKRPEVIQDCTNQLDLWKYCKVFMLTRSMRVNEYACNGEIDNRKPDFNRWVLAVGDGKLPAKKKNRKMSQHGLRFQKNSLSNHGPLQLSRLLHKRTPISL